MHLGWKDKCLHYEYLHSWTCSADNISNAARKEKVEQVLEMIDKYNHKMGAIDKSN